MRAYFDWVRAERCFSWLRRGAWPVMAGVFALYAVMHSPLRDVIAKQLGLRSRVCYFVCGEPSGSLHSATAWALIVSAAGAGWITSRGFSAARYERPLVWGMMALAFVTVPAAAIGGIATWSGTSLLRPPLGPLLAAVPAALVVGVDLVQGWRPCRQRFIFPRVPSLVLLVGGLAAILLVAVVALSVTHPPTGYDALSYHAPLAVFLWREGNLGTFLDRAPDVYALAMPGTVQLWFGLLLVAGGERLANLGQLPFALFGSAAISAFARRLGLGRGAALLAAGAYLLAPSIVVQTGIQVADVAGAGLLMATIALASAPVRSWTRRRLALLGLALGLVATTKLALLPAVAGVMLVVVGTTLQQARGRHGARMAALRLGVVGLVFLTAATPWWVRNVERYGNPVYPAGLPLIGRGIFLSSFLPRIDEEFVPTAAAWPLYPLFERHSERSGLGALFLVGALVGTVAAARRARRRPLLLYGVLVVVMLPSWWILTNHDPRFLLALFGLSFAFLPYSLLALPRHQRRIGGGLLATAAIFSTLVTFDQVLIPLAAQPTIRAEFYDRVWGVDPVVSTLPESEGLLVQTGYASHSYPAYYPLLGESLGRVVIPVDVGIDADSIVGRMRRAGVQYAYVTASPESRPAVEAIYEATRFELLHLSIVEKGWRAGTRRYLYRLR